mmetsp:Transcript_18444/g.40170  ORF Transcript_18444/g.40170 Transcript_18444/m.40170 type:complete len:555 (+) Transcript_18444:103-1767(+)
MSVITSYFNSYFVVALLLVGQFPTFTVSQNQNGDDQSQTNAIDGNADYDALSLRGTNQNKELVFDRMAFVTDDDNVDNDDDDDDDDEDDDDDQLFSTDHLLSMFPLPLATTDPTELNLLPSASEDIFDDDNTTAVESIWEDTIGNIVKTEPETDNGNDVTADEGESDNSEPIDLKDGEESGVSSVQATNGSGNDINQEDDGLSLGGVIGISIGVFVLLVVLAFLIYYVCVFKKREYSNGNASASVQKTAHQFPSSSGTTKRSSSRNDSPVDIIAEQSLLGSEKSNNGKKNTTNGIESSDIANTDDIESQGMYSYNQSYGDSGSEYTDISNIKIHTNNSHNYGNDNTSYAYSLEPGIEASVIEGESTNSLGGVFVKGDSSSNMPIREIPQVSMTPGETTGGKDRNNSTAESKKGDTTYDRFGDTRIEIVPSDLKLTKSELAMLPSNLRSSDDEDENEKNVGDTFRGVQNNKRVLRKVSAPAGKFGVVIDTKVEGPVVHRVNKGSKLSGKIFPGDIIIAIDDVDTRAMSASDISALMVKTANQNRTLTVLGGTPKK